MVDPFSILAVMGEISAIVDRCISLYQKIEDAHRAKKALAWLAEHLKMFSTTLHCFESQIKEYIERHYIESDIKLHMLTEIINSAKADVEKITVFLSKNICNNLKGKINFFLDGDGKLKEMGICESTFLFHLVQILNGLYLLDLRY